MRLIDADALINELYDFADEHTYVNDDGDLIVFEVPTWAHWVISVAPTAEAIPIEWLKRFKAGECQDSYWSWFTDKLIKMWREEQKNETD